jgi:ABC-type sugar transport system ATPase subunit
MQGRKVMQMMVGTCKAGQQPQQQQQQQPAGSSRADSIKALPAPTDPSVRLAVAGGEVVAVMPFEGYITPEVAAAIRKKLADALQAGR